MPSRQIPVSTKVEFFNLLEAGYSVAGASRAVGVSDRTGSYWKKQGFNPPTPHRANGREARQTRVDLSQSDPVVRELLSDEATHALDDFDFFRLRYLGRRPTPWQADAARIVIELLATPHDEYVVINCPPGSGKSTLVSDLCLWLICRDRAIRILIGSSTLRLADKYSNRLRKTLERTRPLPGTETSAAADAALTQDFGRFRPVQAQGDIWTRSEFTVAQAGVESVEDKEPTVAAFGMDTEFLGHRANVVVWDDLVTRKILRNSEQIAEQRAWWASDGETRLEPGGVLVLMGQRMGADDLYRHALDMELGEELDLGRDRKYHHIIYPAHFEDRCEGKHRKDSSGWPNGCLLDPVRLPWTKLSTVEKNRGDAYRVQYQQEDVDPSEVLVPKLWIDGGRGSDGEMFPGCWDIRDGFEIPPNLAPPVLSVASADPSPTKFWSIQHWLIQPETKQRFLLDLVRQSMDAPDFLDWDQNRGVFFGLMDEWQARSRDVGYPITHWIVENNAAQRFILQYDHVRRWQRQHNVQIIAHSTHRNKTDPDYGVQMLKNLYRFGQVRLPGRGAGRIAALKLVDEVTRYPQTSTDDCMMAQWFVEYQAMNGALRSELEQREPIALRRPGWMRRKAA